jgi:hypothetical protein
MKKSFLLVLILVFSVLMFGCGKKAGDTSGAKDDKTEVKKDSDISESVGYSVKYDIKEEKGTTGTLDLSLKGKRIKMAIDIVEKENKSKSQMWFKDDMVYMLTEVAGQKMAMKMDAKQTGDEMKDFNPEMFDKDKLKDKLKDYTKEGTEEVIGYKCDVYKSKTSDEKIWIYKDVAMLKMTSTKTTMVAKEFNPSPKLSDSDFDPPKDVDFKDMKDLLKGLENLETK